MTLLNAADVAAFLQTSEANVRMLVSRGRLPVVRLGARVYFDPLALQKVLGLTEPPRALRSSGSSPSAVTAR